MTREFTCIICPNGCEISADYEIQADQSVVIHSLEGATCKRGAEYVKQEQKMPVNSAGKGRNCCDQRDIRSGCRCDRDEKCRKSVSLTALYFREGVVDKTAPSCIFILSII